MGIDVKAEWKTAGDNRVCDLCNALEGKIFSIDEIEDMIPLHPECRCISLPYIEELQKYRSKPKEEEDWLGLREGINTRKSHITELYNKLTGTIMLRRIKKDVAKELPSKIYSLVPLELDNFKEYDESEKDFIAFVNREIGWEVGTKTNNINTLASIEKLVLLAVKGKLSQSIQWIKNFLEVGCKLVVCTPHEFVIETLMQTFPNVTVKYDRSLTGLDIKETIDDFQTNPNLRLFVGNFQGLEIRYTLPSAINIAFLELPWTPRELVQSVNFKKWIGQKDIVNIYYLFASGTIEERIAKLIESKPSVLDAALNEIETETALLLSALMKGYKLNRRSSI
jgi:SNF2 family DNA or RNA helicase